jgi:predicted TIM-barrel fold metal-dependent hydrolase
MLSRRDFLASTAVAGAGALIGGTDAAFGIASQPSTPSTRSATITPVNFQVPPGACDCHQHIFGDPQRYPAAPGLQVPELATVAELNAMHKALHIQRLVIVQFSAYGTDNTCLLDALKQLGPIARGIVVVDDKTHESELDKMDRLGVCGIRLFLGRATDPAVSRQKLQAGIDWIIKNRPKWHIQLLTGLSVVETIKDIVMAAPMPIVIDHFGSPNAQLGVDQPGFGTLLNLVQSGKAYVKLSAPYHASKQPPAFADVAPFTKALIAVNPQRMLWGTDWPHPGPYTNIDDGAIFNQFPIWVPDPALRKTILVENPAKLFGF